MAKINHSILKCKTRVKQYLYFSNLIQMEIAVLGAGMVGRTIAEDLATSFEVTAFDKNEESLAVLNKRAPAIKTKVMDFTITRQYSKLLSPFDIVVTAVPGFLGFGVLKGVIEAGKNVVDISFSPENLLHLDSLAKSKNVSAIVDCGVAPGMSNLVLGRYNEEMKVEHFECYVGGLPKIRKKPFEYKAPFSPIDVIEEYTRPARLMENGQIIIKEALTELEAIDFEGVGTLEAFNTDGLRSVLYTMSHIPNMKEKTLRYPGHCELILALQKTGFLNREPVSFRNTTISPLEVTSAILLNEWKLLPDEEEFTIMRIIVRGDWEGQRKTVEYNLLAHYDQKTQTSSMARCTGYTCTAAVQLLAQNQISDKGIIPPEILGKNRHYFEQILAYLKARNVVWLSREY